MVGGTDTLADIWDSGLDRISKTVLFLDVIGSVRLIEADEEGTVKRWLEFTHHLKNTVLPSHKGRLVKRLGDGLIIEFDDPVEAVFGAFAAISCLDEFNRGLPDQLHLSVRVGIHIGSFLSGADRDLYGREVNIAARIMDLASADEIVATIDVRDAIAGKMDIDIVDIGDCYLRNVTDPVRVFRLTKPGILPRIRPILNPDDLMPTVAVIPFGTSQTPQIDQALGDILAEEMIVALSRSPDINVTSRLSTSVFRERRAPLSEVGQALHADFVLSGTYHGDLKQVVLDLELAEVGSNKVVWAHRANESITALLQEREAIDGLASAVLRAIVNAEIRRARSAPIPTLRTYSLLMAAVALMNRPSQRDFHLAAQLLRTLMDRTSEISPTVMATMARWHVLRVQQGWSPSPMDDATDALRLTRSALDIDPANVLALVSEGFVLTNLAHRLDDAMDRYMEALSYNPNDATGRLLRGTLYAFRGEGARATRDTERALHLAPLDPHRYFFESLAASACIASGDNERALQLADQSLRSNRGHTSTLRVKAVAELRLERYEDARETVRKLMRLQPNLTISSWLKTSPSADFEVGRAFARSLHEAGVPE